MSRLLTRGVVCAALVLSISAGAWARPKGHADAKVESPLYAAWAKFKPGTKVVWKIVENVGEEVIESSVERELVSIKDDKIILKKGTRKAGEDDAKSVRVKVTRHVSAKVARAWTDPVGKTAEGEETISALAGHKKFKAHRVVFASKGKKGETTTTQWLSDDVPGLLVKREVEAGGRKTTVTLAKLTEPKAGKVAKPGKAVWMTNYKKALARARSEHKLVLLDFTGSDWCGWCIRLDKEVFSTREFKAWAAERVILVTVDFPRRRKLPDTLQKQNDKLQEKHQIQGFPTIVIVDARGKRIGVLGYLEGGPKKWIAEAEKVISSAD